MKEIFIITCYQFEPTLKLIEVMQEFGEIFLVTDRLSEDYDKIKSNFGNKIISEGNFGYYSIDEAIGRLNMFRNLTSIPMDWDMVHIISQNCLPTDAFLFRKNFIDYSKSYIFIDPDKRFLSNYASYTKEMVIYLDSMYDRCMDELLYKARVGDFIVAPSEELWFEVMMECNLPIERGDARRFYVDTWQGKYGNSMGWDYGHNTKKLSPLTLDLTPSTINVLSAQDWYLFARKYDFQSEVYNWMLSEFYKVKSLIE